MTDQAEDLSRFERVALRFYRQSQPQAGTDQPGLTIDKLDLAQQIACMRAIERGAVGRAALAGALSGLCVAIAALAADPRLGSRETPASLNAQILYWEIVLAVTGVATVLEVGFLYWDALRAARDRSYC